MAVRSIVMMGVSGSGKTTIGLALAARLGARFLDGDRLHSDESIAKMAAGEALSDAERAPWLHAVGEHLAGTRAAGETEVAACSALKRSYRDVVRIHVPDVFIVFLDGPREVVERRIHERNHEFMPASLLASQIASLEPLGRDERGLRVDVTESPAAIVDRVVDELERAASFTSTP